MNTTSLNTSIQYISQTIRTCSLVCFAFVCLYACQDVDTVVSPEAFQKIEQEDLGDQLWEALTKEGSTFDILDRDSNEVLYTHVEALYQQSYFILRSKQGWTSSRDWRIAIFVDENQSAFTFPGGNMMISTGMLKIFRKEFELFYLMSFENTLMDSGYLFANFLTFVEDSIDVEKLIEQNNMEEAYVLAQDMVERLEFNAFISEEIDINAMEWICQSSNYRVDGLLAFLPKLDDNSNWLQSRMSSINRAETVRENYLNLNCDNDGRATSLGNSYYIDVILPLIP